MTAKKQILLLVSEGQHRNLATKAKAAGVTIQTLIREHFDQISVAESRSHARFDQLLLTRIGINLERVAEQCRNQDDKMAVVDVLARLIAIERELKNWKEEHGT